MPKGVYHRGERHLIVCKQNLAKVFGIAAMLPRTEKQLEASRRTGCLPKTERQRAASRKNIRKALLAPCTAKHSRTAKLNLAKAWVVNRSPEERARMRERRLRMIFPKKDTVIERLVQHELLNRCRTFVTHHPILGQPDIAFPDQKVAVFCDGDYWHSIPRAKVRDPIVNEELTKQGWLVLRFWEHDIRKDVTKVVDAIEASLLN